MKNINLDDDEGIIKQTTYVERYQTGDKNTTILEMYLTNKNLILAYEKSTGFLKSEDVIEKIPLDNIRIIKDKLQVFIVDNDDYGLGMQIVLKDGSINYFVFDQEKETSVWVNLLINTILESKYEIYNENQISAKDSLIEEKDNSLESVSDQITDEKTDNNENVIKKSDSENNNDVKNNNSKDFTYCSNCGEKASPDSKFCYYCGNPLNSQNSNIDESKLKNKEETKEVEEIAERKIVYEGKIHKCPNCGETIKGFEIKCSSCGYELRNSVSSISIKEFSNRIANTSSDKETAKLIKNFPIPNNKEDILEFMILATSNMSGEISTEVFEAWYSKLEQSYHKAELTFENDKSFDKIQKIYNEACIKFENEKKIHARNDIQNWLSKVMINPFFGIVVIGVVIYGVIRLFRGEFAGIDIIFDAIILGIAYKITNKSNN